MRANMHLYDEEHQRRSRAVRKRFFHRCVRCGWRRSQHAHHVFRAHWSPLVPLCLACHEEVHRTDKRRDLIPLWVDTFLSIIVRWFWNVVAVAVVVIAFLYMHA